MSKFKVVTDTGCLVNGGAKPKEAPDFLGLDETTATADAAARNERAEELGIQTRYEVKPLDEAEAA